VPPANRTAAYEGTGVAPFANFHTKASYNCFDFSFFFCNATGGPGASVIVSATSENREGEFLYRRSSVHRKPWLYSRRRFRPMSRQPTTSIVRGWSLSYRTTLSSTTSCATTGVNQRPENGGTRHHWREPDHRCEQRDRTLRKLYCRRNCQRLVRYDRATRTTRMPLLFLGLWRPDRSPDYSSQ
jgi:hypothetical protein